MAEVISPIVLDSTAQATNTQLAAIAQAITNSSGGGGVTISSGTVDLEDGVTSLPSGQLYLYYSE